MGAAGPFGAGDGLGFTVDGVGDVDGDGLDDIIVGSIGTDVNGTSSGSASVFLSRGELGTSYCGRAAANSTGASGVTRVLGLDAASVNELYVIGIDGSDQRSLTPKLDRSPQQHHWAPDGSGVSLSPIQWTMSRHSVSALRSRSSM